LRLGEQAQRDQRLGKGQLVDLDPQRDAPLPQPPPLLALHPGVVPQYRRVAAVAQAAATGLDHLSRFRLK
jgi:hypothetical protein